MPKHIKGTKILLTGGAGFIGSNLAELLLKRGAEVTVYDNMSSGRYEFIKHLRTFKGFAFMKGDVLDTRKLDLAMHGEGYNAVAHLSANPDVALGTKNTRLDLEQGTVGTYNVLEAARKNDVHDILFASSSVVYGMAKVLPTPEGYGPLAPISLYGASKLASEGLITSFSHLFGMDYYIYRFANVVGRHSTHGVMIDFIKKLKRNPKALEVLGNGLQRKSYIDVEDCVSAMAFVYEKSGQQGNIYNLATDDQMKVDDIAGLVIRRFASGARIKHTGGAQGWPGDVPNAFLSNRKLKAMGFRLAFKRSADAVGNFINGLPEGNQ